MRNLHSAIRATRRTAKVIRAGIRPLSAASRHGDRQVTSVADLLREREELNQVTVTGYIRSVRKQKRVAFAVVNDGSTTGSIQAVLRPEAAAELSSGTAVSLKGPWKRSQGAKQSFELQAEIVAIQGENDAEANPVQPKYQTQEYLRTIPHLRPRISGNALLLRLRSQLILSLTKFFNDEGFVQTHTPIITSSDCEGAGEVFTVSSNDSNISKQQDNQADQDQGEHFFRSPKYLTVSAQLHLEALAQAVNKVWTLSPTFRAEKSDTARHLSEFYMLEAEQCFVNDLEDVLGLVERMLRAVAIELKDTRVGVELLEARQTSAQEANGAEGVFESSEALQKRWNGMSMSGWPRMTYAEAIKILQNKGCDLSHGDELDTAHERILAELDDHNRPTFITDYPRDQKPFYMASSARGRTTACFDLLVPDLCELAGGSLREHRSRELFESMTAKGVVGNNLEWYRDLRRYGSVPHGGFGLGFDRLLCYLAGVGNVRDMVAFPRWYGRCDC